MEMYARTVTAVIAITFQASLLIRHAPNDTPDAFFTSRLGPRWNGASGTLPVDTNFDTILDPVYEGI
jgi:putative acyl-CoA dehydrogenase